MQNFIDFVLKSVGALGGNLFPASMALLELLERLRGEGAATGQPMMVRLVLEDRQLFAQWGDAKNFRIVAFPHEPSVEQVAELSAFLANSVALADPEILLQRNAEMARHFEEARAKAEHELAGLQSMLEQRQREMQEFDLQAHTDALTGLFNRRAFDERLKSAFLHTMRQKASPLSLLLFDLDHFKEINDEFGHQFGDAYLNKMAVVLHEIIREDVDFAFRFGGDEFAVMLFANHAVACEKANLVLRLMENKVSIGIATIDRHTPDSQKLEEFIHRADDALYAAKRGGRGRAIIATCASQASGKCCSPCPEMDCLR
ncbi:MAG TPA: GGDEF domain-containing protein [Gallionella sp.]|nr:GGDEF domain-containing protein [Gallionella sp.]